MDSRKTDPAPVRSTRRPMLPVDSVKRPLSQSGRSELAVYWRSDRPRSFHDHWVRFAKTLQHEKYLHVLFLLPFLYYIIFHYVPMYGVVIAFKDYRVADGITGSRWVGLKHFQQFFANPYAWTLIRNTILLNIYMIVFAFPMPILFALLLNEVRARGYKRFVQTVSYLPYFISVVVVAGMIVSFVSTDGILNGLIVALGGTARPWLMLPEWFPVIYVGSGIWTNTGWNSIVYLAALSALDPQLYEAATIDGANRWQKALHISLPGIIPTITILFLLNLGGMMTLAFQKILLLYTGATYETADVLQTFIYRRGIEGADFSFAAAVGVFQAVVGLFFVISSNAVAKRVGETSLW